MDPLVGPASEALVIDQAQIRLIDELGGLQATIDTPPRMYVRARRCSS